MDETIIRSPNENGEYLVSEDLRDAVTPDGETTETVWAVFFRKTDADGTPDEYDWESWKAFQTKEEALAAVRAEVEKKGAAS